MAKRVLLVSGSRLRGPHAQARRGGGGKAGKPLRRSIRSLAIEGPVGAIVIVAANALLRECLTQILSAANFCVIASMPCADDHALSRLPQARSILLIIDMSDDFQAGLKQIESFKGRYPRGRVVVLADQHPLNELLSAFQAGANAYLAKVATCEAFIKSIELVMLGGTFLPPEVLTLISNRQSRRQNGGAADADDGAEGGQTTATDVGPNKRVLQAEGSYASRLSARQQSILGCLVQGDSNKAIARKMALAEATVKVHIKAILRKVRVRNRTQAAIWAKSNGSFITEDASLGLEKLSMELPFDVNIAHVESASHRNEANHIARSRTLRLVRNAD